jgi:hypothetical protein
MLQRRKLASLGAGLLAMLIITPACALDLNKSISVGNGAESDGESTVNGSISVGEGATINGSLETVNGTIRVDENSKVGDTQTVNGSIRIASGVTADDVSSVNGSIRLGENVTIDGEIEVVNGKISLDKGTVVSEGVSNVNGEISLSGAEIGGDLSTVNGDVSLGDESTLRGDLIVEKPGGWGWDKAKREPKIVIGPGSKVLGNIELEREVELFISESAEVGDVTGVMSMGDAVRFSGDRP